MIHIAFEKAEHQPRGKHHPAVVDRLAGAFFALFFEPVVVAAFEEKAQAAVAFGKTEAGVQAEIRFRLREIVEVERLGVGVAFGIGATGNGDVDLNFTVADFAPGGAGQEVKFLFPLRQVCFQQKREIEIPENGFGRRADGAAAVVSLEFEGETAFCKAQFGLYAEPFVYAVFQRDAHLKTPERFDFSAGEGVLQRHAVVAAEGPFHGGGVEAAAKEELLGGGANCQNRGQ